MVAPIAVSSPKSTLLQNPVYLGDSSSSFFGGSLKGLCLHLKPRPQRRDFSNLAVTSASATPSVAKSNSGGRIYFNITGFPLAAAAGSPTAPPEATEEVLLRIPGAILNLVDKDYNVELACGDFFVIRLRQGDNVVAAYARVAEEIQWPRVPLNRGRRGLYGFGS